MNDISQSPEVICPRCLQNHTTTKMEWIGKACEDIKHINVRCPLCGFSGHAHLPPPKSEQPTAY
jgi:DNA-directed RNA polymerase subunit RPC12/RpoP